MITAAVDRIRFLPGVASMLRFVYLDLLLIPLFIYDFVTIKRIHKITVIGAACIIALQISITMAWGKPGWHKFASNTWKPFMAAAPVEVKLTDAEVAPLLGDYGYSNWYVTIEKIDGKLYLWMPGIPKKELGGSSQTELFVRALAWKINFICLGAEFFILS